MADPPAPRFVAVANATYAELPALTRAVPDSQELADVLRSGHGFEPAMVQDLEREEALRAIRAQLRPDGLPGGSLILSWVGHGKRGKVEFLELMGRSGPEDVRFTTAGELGEWIASTGARQMLVLIDTCYSGGGVVDAFSAAAAVDQGRASPGMASFVVVAASLADEPSRSGVLIRELVRLLKDGPRNPDFRWNRSRKFITGHDLAQALVEDWSEPRHTPWVASAGRVFDLVRNPLYQEGVPDQPVEHLLLAARGGSGDESFFTGRERALTEIVSWMGRGAPGLFVVTGPPGCGKSAVVGRIVSLSSPGERARLLQAGTVAAALDPGPGSVDVQIHARGVTATTASEALAQQLKIDPAAGSFGVLAEARRRRQAGDLLVFVIDGLDEARAFSREVAVELVAPLAREALVLVATRDMAVGDATLIRLLGQAAGTVDLGQDVEETRRDVREYVVRRLTGIAPAMDPAVVAGELAGEKAAPTEAPFLLARLVTSQLREHPVDTSAQDWRLSLSTTVESALEVDLQSVILKVDGQPHPAAAREMIRALALAHGAGFPADDVWPAVATAISKTGARYTRDHAYDVLTSLGRHIIAGAEGGQAVYRIAHQRLVDYMAARSSPAAGSEPAAAPAAAAGAIFRTYEEVLDLGVPAREHTYLWRYAWVHLAEAGDPGLELLRRLVERDRAAFLGDLASGLELAATKAWSGGEGKHAVELAQEAATLRRELGDELRLVLSLFQLALLRSSVGDDDGADRDAAEASALARKAGDKPGARSVLGAALVANAMTQLREGRYKTARLLAEEAIGLADPAKLEKDSGLWQGLAYAHLAAGQAAMALEDLESAETLCGKAVRILDEHVDPTAGRDALLEALGSLAIVEFARALAGTADAAGKQLPAARGAGDRLLAMFRAAGPQRNLSDIAIARGLQFLARSRAFDRLRGLPVAELESDSHILDESIDLVLPLSGEMADAAIILAGGLTQRATLRRESDPAGTEKDLEDAEASLRRFAGQSSVAAVELGQMLAARGELAFPEVQRGKIPDLRPLIDRDLEAASLLRRSSAWIARRTLGSVLSRLASLLPLSGSTDEQETAFRAEAIDVWRSLLGLAPEAPALLVSLLSDQAGRLLDQRTAEAADLAREALDRARELPQPQFATLVGSAELNLAAVRLRMGGVTSDSRELLVSAIGHLEPFAADTVFSGILAAAHNNLAQIEIESGRFTEAVAAARRAVELSETPGQPSLYARNRIQASLALGRALAGSGQTETGTAMVREAIGRLRSALVAGQIDLGTFAAALNLAAPDLWDEALAALRDRPDLTRMLVLIRQRPRGEVARTVRAIAAALAGEPGGETRTIRTIARQQRSVDPENFDAAWLAETGEIPAWLRLPAGQEDLVIAWWNTPSWPLSRKYLEAHPTLLDASTGVVLEELRFDGQKPELVDRHLALLEAARAGGVDAAYAPLLAEISASEWIRSEDPAEHLARNPDLLARPEVAACLAEHAATGDADATAFGAILQLARRGESALAFQAAKDPDSVVPNLRSAWRSKDVARLSALAAIVRARAGSPAAKRTAAAASAIAWVLEKKEEGLASLLAPAVEESTPADRQEMAAAIADAIAHHPEDAAGLARLIPMLGQVSS